MKFPLKLNIFGARRKKSDEDESDEGEAEGESKESTDEEPGKGDDEEAAPPKVGDRRRLIVLGSASAAVLVAVFGTAWWFFASGPEVASGSRSGLRVQLELPAQAEGGGGLTPPPGTLNAVAAGEQGPAAGAAGQSPGAGIMIAATTRTSYAGLPTVAAGGTLGAVPDPALVQAGPQGPLPKIGSDGRLPWKVYARPFTVQDDRPRIAVIIGGLGLSGAATEAAITRLPGAVTLAFDPYAQGLNNWIPQARQAGHEILVGLPMEPANFPLYDPGPTALMTSVEPAENLRRLEFVLAQLPGHVGVLSVLGSRFQTAENHVRPVLEALKARGVAFVDNRAAPELLAFKIATDIGLPRAIADVVLDDDPAKAAVDSRLAEIERIARRNSVGVAVGGANPATLERLAAWAATLESKGLVLAPVSALLDKQFLP